MKSRPQAPRGPSKSARFTRDKLFIVRLNLSRCKSTACRNSEKRAKTGGKARHGRE